MKCILVFSLLGSLFVGTALHARVDPLKLESDLMELKKEHPNFSRDVNRFLLRLKKYVSPLYAETTSDDTSQSEPVVEVDVGGSSETQNAASAQDTTGSDKPLQSASDLDIPNKIPDEVVADFE
ncbi:MAG: hypothetical protein Q8K37_03430, partial [Alphaproteobacteria bacterium]|nr:hypothetical protein [Alphaproteobacteria bacterium]